MDTHRCATAVPRDRDRFHSPSRLHQEGVVSYLDVHADVNIDAGADRGPRAGDGRRVAVPLDARVHPVRLLPVSPTSSARDRRRLVFTLAFGPRNKKLRLRASTEREYAQWTSAIASAIENPAGFCSMIDAKSNYKTDSECVMSEATARADALRASQCKTVSTSVSSRSSCCSSVEVLESLESLSTEVVEDDGATAASTETSAAWVTANANKDQVLTVPERIARAVEASEATEAWRGVSAR